MNQAQRYVTNGVDAQVSAVEEGFQAARRLAGRWNRHAGTLKI
ncbi:hypothetical protein AB9F26_09305 [Falsihalocynthiibacter sp. BN13B15]